MSKKHTSKRDRSSSSDRHCESAFERFDSQMTLRLEKLVDRWKHLAAPKALLVDRHGLPPMEQRCPRCENGKHEGDNNRC